MSISLPTLPAPGEPRLQPGPVTAVAPMTLLAEHRDSPSLPFSTPLVSAPATAQESGADGAAMRPDQAVLARQLAYPAQDAATLARHWRAQVRSHGSQMTGLAIAAGAGQISPAQLAAAQQGLVTRASEQLLPHPDAWRFTVHAGSHQAQHLEVLARDADQPPGRRRRLRALLRLVLELASGRMVVAEVEPLPDGVAIVLCAADMSGMMQLRQLQPELERVLAWAGIKVVRWKFHDRLPSGGSYAMLSNADAAVQALTPEVFRTVTELALCLPAAPLDSSGNG